MKMMVKLYYHLINFLKVYYNMDELDELTKQKLIDVYLHHKTPIVNIDIKHLESKFKVGDKVRYKLKRKMFDKRNFLPTYSLTLHKIINVNHNRYTLDNNKIYYTDELIMGNENNNDLSFDNKLKQNKQEIKAEQLNKIDFKMPIEQIESQKLDTKRSRKKTKYFIHN